MKKNVQKICMAFYIVVLSGHITISQEIYPIDTIKILCKYKNTFLKDSTNKSTTASIDMVLQIGSHLSSFCGFGEFITDSLHYRNLNLDFQTSVSSAIGQTSGIPRSILCNYKVIKNYPFKGSLSFYGWAGKGFRVKEKMTMKWEMLAEKDTIILGYKCQKALTRYAGRTYFAWYTLNIPINEGPYKFHGLPGLIVKIYDQKKQHDFELISLKTLKYDCPIYYNNISYIDTRAQDYAKALQSHINSLLGRIQSNSIGISNEEQKARSIQKVKATNNFIEKY